MDLLWCAVLCVFVDCCAEIGGGMLLLRELRQYIIFGINAAQMGYEN